LIDVGQHGRLVEGADAGRLAARGDPRTRGHRVVDVALHDIALRRGGHRTYVVSASTVVVALPELAHFFGELLQELVVHRRLDVNAFDGNTRLSGVEHATPCDAVGGAFEIRIGKHNRRVLATEFEAVRDQPLGTRHGNLAPRGRRPGELHEVDVCEDRGTSAAFTGRDRKYRRSTDLGPPTDELHRAERRYLGRLQQHRGPGGERGQHVHRGHDEREVPWRDHADEGIRPVHGGQALGSGQ